MGLSACADIYTPCTAGQKVYCALKTAGFPPWFEISFALKPNERGIFCHRIPSSELLRTLRIYSNAVTGSQTLKHVTADIQTKTCAQKRIQECTEYKEAAAPLTCTHRAC